VASVGAGRDDDIATLSDNTLVLKWQNSTYQYADGTEEIIREYEAKYPDIIKPIYEKENQWVKGRKGSAVFNYPRAKGKYIALCEGDDYWTDPLKLQKQVDFLEANPDLLKTIEEKVMDAINKKDE
jgi:glycosyltransferase involved in cell wall biosynthesis